MELLTAISPTATAPTTLAVEQSHNENATTNKCPAEALDQRDESAPATSDDGSLSVNKKKNKRPSCARRKKAKERATKEECGVDVEHLSLNDVDFKILYLGKDTAEASKRYEGLVRSQAVDSKSNQIYSQTNHYDLREAIIARGVVAGRRSFPIPVHLGR
jgi:hypothetical protein